MKYTIKHGLITCLGLAIVAMLLPWFTAGTVFNISGLQLASLWTFILGGLGDLADLFSLVSSYVSSAGVAVSGFWAWFLVAAVIVILEAPFVLTIVSLFMSIFSNSKKSAIGMLVMQGLCSLIGMVYVVLVVRVISIINNVSIASTGVGSYLYFAASVAALIVSIILVKRFAEQEPKRVAPCATGVMCIAGEYLGVSVPLEKSTDVLAIGRDASVCNLVLTGSKISRKHCEISYSPIRGNYRVVDTSTNGTFIKGGSRLERDKATELAPGTVLYLGNEVNSFRLQ